MPEEILSQHEIDALLSAISSGEMDAEELKKEEEVKKVRVYDFKRALRFSLKRSNSQYCKNSRKLCSVINDIFLQDNSMYIRQYFSRFSRPSAV